MPAPVYDRVTGRLYALSSTSQSRVAGYWSGYLTSAGAAFGDQANLTQVWADQGGVYLFLAKTPTDPAAFAAALIEILPQLSPQGWLRFAWIANPNDAASAWQVVGLDATPVDAASGPWRVVRDMVRSLFEYARWIYGGTILELAAAAGGGGVTLAGSLEFGAPGAVYPAQGVPGTLPLQGGHLGSIGFSISLTNGGAAPDDMERLGVMFRYGLADPTSPVGAVIAVDMPLLRQRNATAIALAVNFDPLNPLLPARTALDFFPANSNPPALLYAQKTNAGHGMLATPKPAAGSLPGARFAFGRTPLFHVDDPLSASFIYHLTPDGLFALAPAPDTQSGSEPDRLILGASGAEYVKLPPGGGHILFQAANAAYVPPVPPDAKPGDIERVLLTGLGTTGYAAPLPDKSSDPGLAVRGGGRHAGRLPVVSRDAGRAAAGLWRRSSAPARAHAGRRLQPPCSRVDRCRGADRERRARPAAPANRRPAAIGRAGAIAGGRTADGGHAQGAGGAAHPKQTKLGRRAVRQHARVRAPGGGADRRVAVAASGAASEPIVHGGVERRHLHEGKLGRLSAHGGERAAADAQRRRAGAGGGCGEQRAEGARLSAVSHRNGIRCRGRRARRRFAGESAGGGRAAARRYRGLEFSALAALVAQSFHVAHLDAVQILRSSDHRACDRSGRLGVAGGRAGRGRQPQADAHRARRHPDRGAAQGRGQE